MCARVSYTRGDCVHLSLWRTLRKPRAPLLPSPTTRPHPQASKSQKFSRLSLQGWDDRLEWPWRAFQVWTGVAMLTQTASSLSYLLYRSSKILRPGIGVKVQTGSVPSICLSDICFWYMCFWYGVCFWCDMCYPLFLFSWRPPPISLLSNASSWNLQVPHLSRVLAFLLLFKCMFTPFGVTTPNLHFSPWV